MRLAAVTFDIDLVDHLNGGEVDEMELAFPLFQQFCKENPWFRSTWFVRIDDQMASRFGTADYIFKAHAAKIQWLRENGHEIAWHFHSFVKVGNGWDQNTNEEKVAFELSRNWEIAQKYELQLLRMGWTYHTNLTMKTVSGFGLLADCSALPRPDYHWDLAKRSWAGTPETPYYPSVQDYRQPGNPCYSLLEFPLSVAEIEAPYDTDKQVKRYINPCYHSEIFRKAVSHYSGQYCNLISHPYEFLASQKTHEMLAFNFNTFCDNIMYLRDIGYTICPIGEQVKAFNN